MTLRAVTLSVRAIHSAVTTRGMANARIRRVNSVRRVNAGVELKTSSIRLRTMEVGRSPFPRTETMTIQALRLESDSDSTSMAPPTKRASSMKTEI
jgi:hypothetical protein